jgi:hypothetical protein
MFSVCSFVKPLFEGLRISRDQRISSKDVQWFRPGVPDAGLGCRADNASASVEDERPIAGLAAFPEAILERNGAGFS